MGTDERTPLRMMHYCQGTWVDGFVLDCEAEEHNVRLIQSKEDNEKAGKIVPRKGPDVD